LSSPSLTVPKAYGACRFIRQGNEGKKDGRIAQLE
jgi:hypothetical protein